MAVGRGIGGRRQAWARPGHRKGAEEMAVGWGAVVVGREADEGPKENGGRAYALPPFVMRGCALLRLSSYFTIPVTGKPRYSSV